MKWSQRTVKEVAGREDIWAKIAKLGKNVMAILQTAWNGMMMLLEDTRWAPGEPNLQKGKGKEKCVEIYSNGLWNDNSCVKPLPALCGRRLKWKGRVPNPNAKEEDKLGWCEGNCNVNEDCKERHLCVEKGVVPPGCIGTPERNSRYCFDRAYAESLYPFMDWEQLLEPESDPDTNHNPFDAYYHFDDYSRWEEYYNMVMMLCLLVIMLFAAALLCSVLAFLCGLTLCVVVGKETGFVHRTYHNLSTKVVDHDSA